MTEAYTHGIHHTLHVLAWLLGTLTVLVVVTGLALAAYLVVARPTANVVRRHITTRRLHRTHTRSGRH